MTFFCKLVAVSMFLIGASLEATHSNVGPNKEEDSSSDGQTPNMFVPLVTTLRTLPDKLVTAVREKAEAQEKQRELVKDAVGKKGDKAFETIMKDPELSELVEAGDPDKLAERLGATVEKDKEAVNKLIAKNMAEREPAKLYAHYFKQHIENNSEKKNERKTDLDDAVNEQVGKLKEKHKELLGQFEKAGVRGGKPEWRAIRLEMADQAIKKAKELQVDPRASVEQKQGAWAAAAKATDGLMSSITNRPALAKALLETQSDPKSSNLGRFLGRAAEVSTMSPVPLGRENLLKTDKAESIFQPAFLQSWNATDGGRQRIAQWNQDVASGKKELLDSKYSGWVDHAIETQNVNATWLAKANQGKWQYELNGKTFELSNKQSLSAFFAAMEEKKGDIGEAFLAMELAQANIEARSRGTSPRNNSAPAASLPVSLEKQVVNLDNVAAHLSSTASVGIQTPVQIQPVVGGCSTGKCPNRPSIETSLPESTCPNGICQTQ